MNWLIIAFGIIALIWEIYRGTDTFLMMGIIWSPNAADLIETGARFAGGQEELENLLKPVKIGDKTVQPTMQDIVKYSRITTTIAFVWRLGLIFCCIYIIGHADYFG